MCIRDSPTSYIETTTTAVTRNADVLLAGDIVTDAAGSGYAEASSIWSTAGSTSAMLLARENAGRILYNVATLGPTTIKSSNQGGAFRSEINGTSYLNSPQSLASTWGSGLTAYFNGTPDPTPSAYTGTFGTGNLAIGGLNTGGIQWDGTVREVKIFDSELTAEEVGDL